MPGTPVRQMSVPQYARLSTLLDEAVELDDGARDAWLAALSQSDSSWAAYLRDLFAAQRAANAHDFLENRSLLEPHTESVTVTDSGLVGKMFGPYRVLSLLGIGGMGNVWLAERVDGLFTRQVALKLLHPALTGRVVTERFTREREILASLNHSNIARLIDAGFTDDGQSYLALEYIEGVPLTTYCDEHELTIRQRLAIFRQVLSAVQFAHAHLVIHRDLKPTNILVAREGQVFLLDFGIAKLLIDGEAKETELTQLGGRAMTPGYAAPEQILGAPITTAADGYALGVMLYELLTGVLPYKPKRDSRASLEEAILAGDLLPPSRAAFTGSAIAARATNKTKLASVLSGDLDTIVMKALKQLPAQRYATANAFDEDIARYLLGEVVLAQADSVAYRSLKFARRHWVGLAVAGVLLATLAGGLAATTYEANVAAHQRDEAKREAGRADGEAKKANAVKDFLLDIFKQSSLRNPNGAEARHVTAEQLLDIGATRIKVNLRDDPEARGELLDTLGLLYDDLGFPDRGVELQEERLRDLKASAGGVDSRDIARAELRLGKALDGVKPVEAERHLNEALRILDRLNDRDSIDRAAVLMNLARSAYYSKSLDDMASRRDLFAALDIVDRHHPNDPLRGDIAQQIGSFAKLEDNFQDAERWERDSLATWERLGVEENAFEIGKAYLTLADTLALDHQYDEAERGFRQAVELLTRAAGPDHPDTAEAKSRLGEMYGDMGRSAEGADLLRQALVSLAKTTQGIEDSTEAVKSLSRLEFWRGRLGSAEMLLRQNLAQLHVPGGNELRYGVSASYLALILAARGEFVEADRLYAVGNEIFARYLGAKSLGYARHLVRGVHLALLRGDDSNAGLRATAILAAWPAFKDQVPYDYNWLAVTLARIDARAGRTRPALDVINAALGRTLEAPDHNYRTRGEAEVRYALGITLTAAGRSVEAEPQLRRVVQIREHIDDPDSPWLAQARIGLAACLLDTPNAAEVRPLLLAAKHAQAKQQPLAEIYRQELRAVETRLQASRAQTSL